jgi:branched-chain amino acid transport system permease protein
VFIYAIGAIGLNLVTGYAGQVSLGHAFFVGLGAYTAAYFGGAKPASVRGLELEMWIWLPLAGLVPAFVGFLVAPLAARVRGLYLAILTLGLVFIGEHLFKEAAHVHRRPRRRPSRRRAGRGRVRPVAAPDDPRHRASTGSTLFYLFCLGLLIVFAIAARNLARSKVGRAFAAVRDRDIAAEVMGVPLTRTKVLAFTISSFYAGICGGLLAVVLRADRRRRTSTCSCRRVPRDDPDRWGRDGLGLDHRAAFVVMLPRIVQDLSPGTSRSSARADGRGSSASFQLEGILFGVLIVVFLVLEPRGLYGLWLRVRNYWKAWPFSY